MPFTIDKISSSPIRRTFSDEVVRHSPKMSFALNAILAIGLLTSFFTGGASLIVAASIYGALVLATNGPFLLAIRNMRNSNTEMKLAWQAANTRYFKEPISFESFKQMVERNGKGWMSGIMISHFWSLSETEQQRIRNMVGVSKSDCAAYRNSRNAIDNLKTAEWVSGNLTCRFEMIEDNLKKGEEVRERWMLWLQELCSSQNPDDTLKKIRDWLSKMEPQHSHMYLELLDELETAERQEEKRETKVIIAWQMWLQDSAWDKKTRGESFDDFETWLNRFNPAEKEARLNRYVSDCRRKPLQERKEIARRVKDRLKMTRALRYQRLLLQSQQRAAG